MDLIVHISLSFLEGKNETWHFYKKNIKKWKLKWKWKKHKWWSIHDANNDELL